MLGAPRQSRATTEAIGIDGCADGWVACVVPLESGLPRRELATVFVSPALADLLQQYPNAIVAIDMPIGLPDVPQRGGRSCDRAARAALPSNRKSSIFSPPTAAALQAAMQELRVSESRTAAHARASTVNQSLAPAGVRARIAAQCFGLFPKLHEVASLVTPALQSRIFECHPELVFDLLAGGRPIARKKDVLGRTQREDLLRSAGFVTVETLVASVRGRGVKSDDVLDALACAHSACRLVNGTAERFGDDTPGTDGLRPAIWR